MNISIGTKNPTKVNAIKSAFAEIGTNFNAYDVSSGVSPQPFSDEETIQGAINRAHNALEMGQTEIGIGLEGGVVETKFGLFLCNWGALIDEANSPIIAGGARILLPQEFTAKLKSGMELAEVMDEFTSQHDIRKKEGAIGIFTDGRINRTDMFAHVSTLLMGQYMYKKK
ncbi:DUF84 family protein [Litchfieldia alkalitelluris]|uniref:DUF84 family protein n=1 Tax=Litchfieldia alkalitelluris TaxID=304268 RepID=UPI0009989A50|nr:DUF84 family protein [Litchfieldia alkalitelluris]